MPVNTLRLARAPLAAFAAMGVCWGTFAADLPDIKSMLQVDETQLGQLLLMTPIAAILSMLAAARISRALGRWALPVLTLAMALVFALPGQTTVWWLFPVAMLAGGATTGAVDVLMNARATMVEVAAARPLMNLCHAAYSFGLRAAFLFAALILCLIWVLAPLLTRRI